MEYWLKLNEKYTAVLYFISSFEGTSWKKLQDAASVNCPTIITTVFK